MDGQLTGRVVAVTADRRGDDQVVMFERLGAEVVHGATMSTRKVPDPGLLRARTQQLIDRPPDFLVADTGVGIRTWMACLEGWGLADDMRRALDGTRIAVRGPKAGGALTSVGLKAWWRSPTEQLAEVVDHLLTEGLDGCRVAFQLHGDDSAGVVARLEAAGAEVVTLPVYVWGPPEDAPAVAELIDRLCTGTVDALTFTAGPQVTGLIRAAADRGRADELRAAAGSVVVGCIGPVCEAVAVREGLTRTVVPEAWRLGSLVKAVAAALTA